MPSFPSDQRTARAPYGSSGTQHGRSTHRSTMSLTSQALAKGHLAELFEAAGLRDIESTAISVNLEHSTFDAWREPFTRGVGPAGVYLASLDAGPAHYAARGLPAASSLRAIHGHRRGLGCTRTGIAGDAERDGRRPFVAPPERLPTLLCGTRRSRTIAASISKLGNARRPTVIDLRSARVRSNRLVGFQAVPPGAFRTVHRAIATSAPGRILPASPARGAP